MPKAFSPARSLTTALFLTALFLFVREPLFARSPLFTREPHIGHSPFFTRAPLTAKAPRISVTDLLTNSRSLPMGVLALKPNFSWQLHAASAESAATRNEKQTAYEIRVSEQPGGKDPIWNSGKVISDQSILVAYEGKSLRSGQKYYWQVRVWDNKGDVSDWSETAWWTTGLFNLHDWKATWISPGYNDQDQDAQNTGLTSRPSPLFRKEFKTVHKLKSAFAYITSHGLYEARINGQRVGDSYLTPGWTSYNKRLPYQVYDVTTMVRNGNNAIGLQLGNGWYSGYIAFEGQKNYYGKDISVLFQLILQYTDGTTDTIATNDHDNWKSSPGAIRMAEIYHGETYDARQEKKGWDLPGYDDAGWSGVKENNFTMNNLIGTENETIKKHETFQAVKLITTPKGEQVLDFGQNLVGWVIVKARGKAGEKITISHAEVLDKAGNFYTDNLRAAKAQDTYILSGEGQEVFEPHFTFHGFRYIRVEGYPGTIDPADFTAVTLYSDMKRTGDFHCSNALINQLQHNIQWGQRGNFLDVPTDCPQRDERLGWTGDAQVFSRTAAYNMGVHSFFSKWLKDIAADQFPSGGVPFVIPNVLGPDDGNSAGWADVSTIIPWNIYLAYGDPEILTMQYSSMVKWVEYMHGQSQNDLWNTGFHFGDWLFYRPRDDNDGRSAVTDKYLIAQCFYANSVQMVINAAGVIGKKDDADHYTTLLKKIKDAFIREYLTPSGRLVSGTQTAYVLALQFDMLPEPLRAQAALRLVQNIKDYDYHLTTGFLGTPYLCHVLTRFGYTDIAYKLLLQESYPSWLYPVKMGATTIWERWDGIRPDSSFQTPGMNSFNHYAYGAIGDWMYKTVAGIDTYTDGPGYRHSRISPHPGGGLSNASSYLLTGYGKLSSSWQLAGDSLLLDLEIPANTTSTVYLPAPQGGLILEDGHPLKEVKDIKVAGVERGYLILDLGSGIYHFSIKNQ